MLIHDSEEFAGVIPTGIVGVAGTGRFDILFTAWSDVFITFWIWGTGSIVLMSGAFGQRPLADGASYAACNGAIESLGKALAVELAPIRVNVISPGTIHTSFNWEGAEQDTRDNSYDEYTNMNILGRVGHADEAAHTTIYLMTNKYTTGSTLFPDGGYILR